MGAGKGPGQEGWEPRGAALTPGSAPLLPGVKPGSGRGASHLHPRHVDAGPHLEVGAHLDDPGHAVEQHVVELRETPQGACQAGRGSGRLP